jgi:hypothetical protein
LGSHGHLRENILRVSWTNLAVRPTPRAKCYVCTRKPGPSRSELANKGLHAPWTTVSPRCLRDYAGGHLCWTIF